ncbi:MAG: hypothetical protein EOO04_03620, partial [Chitinophagaceae bacterium]
MIGTNCSFIILSSLTTAAAPANYALAGRIQKIENMKMYKLFLRVFLCVVVFNQVSLTYAQDGDQILDGIGETGMIAR